MIKALLFTHRYISFLPEDMVAAELAAGSLVRLDIPWLVWQRELYLTTRRDRTLSPAAQFMKTLAADRARADFARAAQ
ncbi:LysR substrate-binding domain-containing protein [Neopusillimonas aromaticivorans]|uniref:LysR substrate-binding domain-containing protein n=1 Tax=Neopusillimonas aromaticivorans TaxID=2979868 RepID=UPI002598DE2B|nr:LysR substrate-binding domain-containing protein [Neopusillimonas aromaticivorans]WJJ94763.1 LysR substrate-binding domain-containing protein [Neopusillimonas aromaticivorans]